MNMRTLLAVLASIAVASVVCADGAGDRWEPIGRTNLAATSMDSQSLIRSSESVQVWVKYDYFQVQEERIRSTRVLWEIDCKKRKMRRLSATDFPEPDLRGEKIADYGPDSAWTPIAPETWGERLIEAAC